MPMTIFVTSLPFGDAEMGGFKGIGVKTRRFCVGGAAGAVARGRRLTYLRRSFGPFLVKTAPQVFTNEVSAQLALGLNLAKIVFSARAAVQFCFVRSNA
jgi:hypothetical protein